MKTTRVTVRWKRGLHMLTAAQLVRLAQRFHSSIRLRLGTRIADARSILNLMLLSATLGTSLEIEAAGKDELEALRAMEDFFSDSGTGDNPASHARHGSETSDSDPRSL